MKILFYSVLLSLFTIVQLNAQTSYSVNDLKVKQIKKFDPAQASDEFNVRIYNQEVHIPGGGSYKAFLNEQKRKVAEKYPRKIEKQALKGKTGAAQPSIEEGLYLYRIFRGERQIYSGGIPNDNAMAISNDNILLGAVNSILWAYDIDNDTAMFPKQIIGLDQFVDNANDGHCYDPKLIYDENEDRFILVFLQGNLPNQSKIWVCFSSSNNPLDEWYSYSLPGNPLNNNRWTDFPAVSIVNNEIFITGNLIIPNVSWQIGFDGSVIWQLNKLDGFANTDSVRTRFYSGIKTDDRFIRNLHPVRGVQSAASEAYFLSNRNFDISNDTIFLLNVGSTIDEGANLDIKIVKTDVPYGVPPNGIQADTDTTDPTKGLQTNDGRVLGAITNGDWIQYVSTTVNPTNGRAAIYHGVLTDPANSPGIKGHIIGDVKKDYAYPNIAFSGNEVCDKEFIVGFNYSSRTDFPGVAATYIGNDGSYSEVITIKEGENYVDKHSDSYERWGDYFAIQPKYNEPGKVWTAGFYGFHPQYHRNGTWLNKLGSPDDDVLYASAAIQGKIQFCDAQLVVSPSGGTPPYTYIFKDTMVQDNGVLRNICEGNDSIFYTIKDSRGCEITGAILPQNVSNPAASLFPNPVGADVVTRFNMPAEGNVAAYIMDMRGNVVKELFNGPVQAGQNELYFDMSPLKQGVYVVKIFKGKEEELLSERVLKVD